MKIKKLNVVKANIGDTLSRGKPVLYGKYFKEDLDSGKWTQESIKNNLDRFFGGNWGVVTDKIEEINKKHVKEGKGNITGIYPRDKQKNNDMIIFYSEQNDCIYILSSFDFESFEEAWISGDEKYTKEFGSGAKYKEPGHQLKREQKEFLRELYPNYDDVKQSIPKEIKNRYLYLLNKDKNETISEEEYMEYIELKHRIDKINEENEAAITRAESLHYPSSGAGSGTLHRSEIEATKNAIEKGKTSRGLSTNLPADAVQVLKNLATKYNVDYMDIVEKIAEENILNKKNLKNSYETVLKNIEQPHFFSDSKRPEWLTDEFIEDVIYDAEWPLTVDVVVNEIVKNGFEDKDAATKYVNEYLTNNPQDKKHFKFTKVDLATDSTENFMKILQKKLMDIMVKHAVEELALETNEAKDYIIVDVEQKDDYIKIQIRNDLFSFYENDDLINELNKVVEKYDAYFDPWDSTTWDAYIYSKAGNKTTDTISERVIDKSEDVYKTFEKAAKMMTEQSPKGYHYYVGDTYLDAGQDWKWTTIITNDGGYQALNPKEWKNLYVAKTDNDIQKVVDAYFASSYNPDRKRG